jgi:hypothetical protein
MNRTRLNLIIDIVAFIGFVALTTTGVLMRYILPPGSGHYSTIWGLDRHEWGGIHFWISLGFFLILAFHLVTHWRWIVSVVKGKPREGSGMRAGLGIVGLVTVIALAASPLVAPVARDTGRTGGSLLSSHKYEDLAIRGSTTLAEIERASGVPAAHIVRSLGLPASTSPGEQLGQLKRAYGFEIDDVREIVKRYRDAQ